MLRTDGDFHCFSHVLFLCMHLGNLYFCWIASLYVWTFSAFFSNTSGKNWGQYRPHALLMQSYFSNAITKFLTCTVDFSQAFFYFGHLIGLTFLLQLWLQLSDISLLFTYYEASCFDKCTPFCRSLTELILTSALTAKPD